MHVHIFIKVFFPAKEVTLCYNNFLEDDGPVTRRERRDFLNWAYRCGQITFMHAQAMSLIIRFNTMLTFFFR